MIFVGCDLGSTTGKIVVMDEDKKILASSNRPKLPRSAQDV